MIFCILMGILGLIIGAAIQYMNMKDSIRRLEEDKLVQLNSFVNNLEELKELYKDFAVETNNLAVDPDHSQQYREYNLTASEVWRHAARCAQSKLEELNDSICRENKR